MPAITNSNFKTVKQLCNVTCRAFPSGKAEAVSAKHLLAESFPKGKTEAVSAKHLLAPKTPYPQGVFVKQGYNYSLSYRQK